MRSLILIHDPSPRERLFFLLSGAIISVPFSSLANGLVGSYLTYYFSRTDALAYASIVAAPFFEEFAKCYPLFYRHGENEKSITSLGFLSGLGFGISEFCLYVFAYGVPPIDRLPLIFFHATNTAIVSYGIGTRRPLLYFLMAVAMHAVYNYLIQQGTGLAYLVVFLSILIYLSLSRKTRDVFYDYANCVPED